MVTIELNNHKSKLRGSLKTLNKIQKAFQVKHPNAFFLRRGGYVQSDWDGKIKYVTDAFYFKTGLLTQIINYIRDELGKKVEIEDLRKQYNIKPKVPKKIGNLTPRPYQTNSIKSVINNKVAGVGLPFGVLDMATNAGKTMIMAGIYLAYHRKIPAIVLINDGDLFDQFKKEIPELLGDDVGFVRGKEKDWKKFTVCMVQTLSKNLSSYKYRLANYGMVLVDEADLADNKTYKKILENCNNASIRLGLSGTIYMSKLKKDESKNQNIRSYFGEVLYKITKKEMVEKGYSTELIIKVIEGNVLEGIEEDWKKEYDRCITFNEDRLDKTVRRLVLQTKLGRIPALVVCKFHDQVDVTYRAINNSLGKKYRVEAVHHETKGRRKIISDFREGKIDILISSLIVKRGKNFPLLRYLLNAAGGVSQETVSQLMGRGERKHESKKKTIIEDFYDRGYYLERHAKRRITYYKKEGFKVIEKYKE